LVAGVGVSGGTVAQDVVILERHSGTPLRRPSPHRDAWSITFHKWLLAAPGLGRGRSFRRRRFTPAWPV